MTLTKYCYYLLELNFNQFTYGFFQNNFTFSISSSHFGVSGNRCRSVDLTGTNAISDGDGEMFNAAVAVSSTLRRCGFRGAVKCSLSARAGT